MIMREVRKKFGMLSGNDKFVFSGDTVYTDYCLEQNLIFDTPFNDIKYRVVIDCTKMQHFSGAELN